MLIAFNSLTKKEKSMNIDIKEETKLEIIDIVKNGLDKVKLTDWAYRFLIEVESDSEFNGLESIYRAKKDYLLIDELRPQMHLYKHNPKLPPIPGKPYWALHGIGIIYDHDKDDRILPAIHRHISRVHPEIVAVGERKGRLTVYSTVETDLGYVDVCYDEWVIEENFVPKNGEWVDELVKYKSHNTSLYNVTDGWVDN